ncbi:2'-5' RNA ligase family protein, partial [Nocardioides kribbensis]|uniref:2'-5' RNA ligase family protein n=1 Tax=Nocardioides kribbensis TaxID=305517 RepID=UPI0032DA3540
MITIGVAVAIPEPWASELQAYRASVGDATAAMIPTHITLVPPTDIVDGELEQVSDHLRSVADGLDGFRVHLR